MERDIQNFLAALASKAPTPGGGGAAALCGAVGIALGNMVGNLTLGKKKYAEVQEDIAALNAKAESLRADFLALIDADADAFEPLSRAYGIPKDDPTRGEVMEAALLAAVQPPLEIMRKCVKALELIADYAAKGSALAISDAGCAAAITRAACEAAALNVFVNTKPMRDREKAGEINREANELLQKCALAREIYNNVTGRLS
ncbi:MAG TPA: cyclodeaminase/cyclohydrolase family protein [Candidatus Scatomorpha merdipullorum]|uniref:Cyclodeaminase/cyclohydrolase family protein n=1 Tax=Candidatus Scatomorpha merdipullorum TaxID=2840927 RepID=A0A9D1JVU1_9FIRM|nr:cyclodeaminase/cyclohydrolase family protein [Candidatus Scatomorpha merdipullorum]